jgi:hypothetical protein
LSPEVIAQNLSKRRRYPWAEWCDGKARRFVRGEDFDIPVVEFRNRFYNAKNRRPDVSDVVTRTELEAFVIVSPAATGGDDVTGVAATETSSGEWRRARRAPDDALEVLVGDDPTDDRHWAFVDGPEPQLREVLRAQFIRVPGA